MTITTKSSPVGDDLKSPSQPVPPLQGLAGGGTNPNVVAQHSQNVSNSAAHQSQDEVPGMVDGGTGGADVSQESTEGEDSNVEGKTMSGEGEKVIKFADDIEVEFPTADMGRLDEMINRPRWVVPVLPKGELEVLLDASISLCKKGEQGVFTYRAANWDSEKSAFARMCGRSWEHESFFY